ncbi:MAG: hypothetical protein GXX78_15240 [Bacteroidales bacterium]|nr:hypothetical protein [Bacteroidales bacterium]
MDKTKIYELDSSELQLIEGGSLFSEAVSWLAGAMFATPGMMADRGASALDIQGSK